MLGAQVVLIAVSRVAVAIVFSGNPGSTFEWHLPENIVYLSNIENYFRFESLGPSFMFPSGLAIPYPKGLNLPLFIVLAIIVFRRWKFQPLFLRRAIVIIPVLYGLCLFFGIISELRSCFEELPIVFLLVSHGAFDLIERKFRTCGT